MFKHSRPLSEEIVRFTPYLESDDVYRGTTVLPYLEFFYQYGATEGPTATSNEIGLCSVHTHTHYMHHYIVQHQPPILLCIQHAHNMCANGCMMSYTCVRCSKCAVCKNLDTCVLHCMQNMYRKCAALIVHSHHVHLLNWGPRLFMATSHQWLLMKTSLQLVLMLLGRMFSV